jgi:hypothetical protein
MENQKLIDDHIEFLTNMEIRLLRAHFAYEAEIREYYRWMFKEVASHFFKHGVEWQRGDSDVGRMNGRGEE